MTTWAMHHKGRAAAAGLLCAMAATIAVWSGPLAAASGALHTGQGAGAGATNLAASAPHHIHLAAGTSAGR